MGVKSNFKTGVIGVVVMLIGLYHLGSPFMDDTNDMRKELAKIETEIRDVRDEAAQYGPGWEKKQNEIETKVVAQLPDSINSSAILDYFVSKFEQANTEKVWFLSVSQAPVAPYSLNMARASTKEAPRVARYKFEANMTQDRVVPYIEHIEGYSGMFMVNDYSFSVTKDVPTGLKMEMNVQFFLAPKEWTPPDKLAAHDKDDEADEEDDKPQAWRQIFLSNLVTPSRVQRKPAFAAPRKFPTIQKILGHSVISDERLYEEGDRVSGWTIQSVNPATGIVILKAGGKTRKVVVK